MTIDFKAYAEQAIKEAYEHGPPQEPEPEEVCGTCGNHRYVSTGLQSVVGSVEKVAGAIPCPRCVEPLETRLRRAGVTKSWRNFNISDPTLDAYTALGELLEGKRWSVTLKGGYGIGKTHMAMGCAEAWIEKGGTAKVINVPEFLGELRKAIDEDGDSIDRRREHFGSIGLLVLDDFGAERRSEWTTEQLYMVVDDRYRRRVPLIVTTNVALTDRRVMSRLGPGLVEIKSADQRQKYER